MRGRPWGLVLAMLVSLLALTIGAPASAAPRDQAAPDMQRSQPGPLDTVEERVEPSIPMPVPSGAFGYLATRSATLWLNDQDAADRIKALPVPPEYRRANDALAEQTKRELEAAVRTPGACVQIIIHPHSTNGNLFDYGVWSVARQYCPQS